LGSSAISSHIRNKPTSQRNDLKPQDTGDAAGNLKGMPLKFSKLSGSWTGNIEVVTCADGYMGAVWRRQGQERKSKRTIKRKENKSEEYERIGETLKGTTCKVSVSKRKSG
jgi:hypothetical protein